MNDIQMIRALCGDVERKNRGLDDLLATVGALDNDEGDLAKAVRILVGVARGSGLLVGGAPDTLEVDGVPVTSTERAIYAAMFIADRGGAEVPPTTAPDMARRAGVYNDFGDGASGLRTRVERAIASAENAMRWHRDVKAGAR